MNYTREPIIETVITPKEGSTLVLRSTKRQSEQEDYFVDAVEIVSFGSAIFFRSFEKPKPFLLPVTDYEVIELRETKMVLKSASLDKSIKIGGGKDTSKTSKEDVEKRPSKKKTRRRRPITPQEGTSQELSTIKEPDRKGKGGDKTDETLVSSSVVSCLITPPPTVLIKDKISQYKADQDAQERLLQEKVEKLPEEAKKKENKVHVKKEIKEKASSKKEPKESEEKTAPK